MKKIIDLFLAFIFLPLFNLYFSLSKKRVAEQIYEVIPGLKLKIRPNTTDAGIISEIFDLKEYSAFPIGPHDTVIDIGAHLGAFSVYAAKNSPASRVFSYEPEPHNYKLLLENIKLNNLKNIIPKNLAVAGEPGKLNLYLDPGNFGGNSIYGSKKCITVNATSLSQIFTENRLKKIDLLKIDAEGAEYDILLNAPKKYLDKINKIALEYHDYFPTNHNVQELKNFLENNGFKVSLHPFPILGHIYKTGLLKATNLHANLHTWEV